MHMSGTTPHRSQRRTARQMRDLDWSDADLDAMTTAEAMSVNADAGVVSWDRYAPKAARGLLDAVEEDDDAG